MAQTHAGAVSIYHRELPLRDPAGRGTSKFPQCVRARLTNIRIRINMY